ncbi:MAG: hypothetical protein OHK005_04540 [Candidatus Methylacidiphilales bacterium]
MASRFFAGLTLALLLLNLPSYGQEAETSDATNTPVPPETAPESTPPSTPQPTQNGSVSDPVLPILEKDKTEVAGLLERLNKAMESRRQELLKALDIQLKAAQNAGDLDTFLELRKEIQQVKKGLLLGEPTHQPADNDGRRSFAILKRARDAYNDALKEENRALGETLTRLNQETGDQLHKVMRDLTRAGEIDAAIAARAEMKRIRERKPSDILNSVVSIEGLPQSEHAFSHQELAQRLLKTTWRQTILATGGQEVITFERGVTQRGQRWDALPDGTVMLTAGRNVEIWTFNATLTEAKGYERGSNRVSFTALRQ